MVFLQEVTREGSVVKLKLGSRLPDFSMWTWTAEIECRSDFEAASLKVALRESYRSALSDARAEGEDQGHSDGRRALFAELKAKRKTRRAGK